VPRAVVVMESAGLQTQTEAKKIRIYEFARELGIESKQVVEICKQAQIPAKSQLSTLDAEQQELVRKFLREGPGPSRPAGPVEKRAEPAAPSAPVAGPSPTPAGTGTQAAPATAETKPATPATALQPTPTPRPHTFASFRPIRDLSRHVRGTKTPQKPAEQEGKPGARKPEPSGRPLPVVAPGVLPGVAVPPKPKGGTVEKKPEPEKAQKPIARLPELLEKRQTIAAKDVRELTQAILKKSLEQEQPAVAVEEDEEETPRKGRPGVVKGREERHRKRVLRARDRHDFEETVEPEKLLLEEEQPALPVIRRVRSRAPAARPVAPPRKGKVTVEPPLTVRTLSEALGIKANDILRKLLDRGQLVNINAPLAFQLAEELALDYGVELEVKKPADPEEQLLAEYRKPDRPEDLVPRAPVVTVMGHVDHGKTSLLDRIRESNVVATEAGGITQHLRAWRVQRDGRFITFLDTPGHEAFTQMRARGAQVTDIVVLVVAADDGVMPQTEEALNHARAAGVPIIVAINKVDLPNANVQRTRNQLYSLGLIPDDMGGDTPFVETVAAPDRPRGIGELLDMIHLVAELRELKANPNKPGRGTCLEARLSENEGVVATLLVQDGTLRRGDVILCGTAYGRVRAMYDDLGRFIDEAGPSWPVRVTGLDEAPQADDKFMVVPDLNLARTVAERRKERQRLLEPVRKATFRLEDLAKEKIAEIKVILKADVRGSIEAIRKELEKITHEEVRIHVLHSGIGAITESDVQLALASPSDTLIIGFNVVPDPQAQALAEAKGVQIRLYDIIYQLVDDIRAALAGKLAPQVQTVHLGRAVVRETFKISKVGTVAGCYVTQGTIERSARVRIIRDGVVVYPPADKTASIESLRRFKEDVREVREGFECGIKIAGYDDIKVGDVIEAFRIEEVQRTL